MSREFYILVNFRCGNYRQASVCRKPQTPNPRRTRALSRSEARYTQAPHGVRSLTDGRIPQKSECCQNTGAGYRTGGGGNTCADGRDPCRSACPTKIASDSSGETRLGPIRLIFQSSLIRDGFLPTPFEESGDAP